MSNGTCLGCGESLRARKQYGYCRQNPECERAYRACWLADHQELVTTDQFPLRWPALPIPQEFPAGKRLAPLRESDVERFLLKIERDGDCIKWRGYLGPKNGYGYYGLASQVPVLAHRFAYIVWRGDIPDDLPHLDHLCHNRAEGCPGDRACLHRACVNPEHLDPVTRSMNLMRSPLRGNGGRSPNQRNRAKTHCDAEHEFTEANTYMWQGQRHCRICRHDAQLRRHRGA